MTHAIASTVILPALYHLYWPVTTRRVGGIVFVRVLNRWQFSYCKLRKAADCREWSAPRKRAH